MLLFHKNVAWKQLHIFWRSITTLYIKHYKWFRIHWMVLCQFQLISLYIHNTVTIDYNKFKKIWGWGGLWWWKKFHDSHWIHLKLEKEHAESTEISQGCVFSFKMQNKLKKYKRKRINKKYGVNHSLYLHFSYTLYSYAHAHMYVSHTSLFKQSYFPLHQT